MRLHACFQHKSDLFVHRNAAERRRGKGSAGKPGKKLKLEEMEVGASLQPLIPTLARGCRAAAPSRTEWMNTSLRRVSECAEHMLSSVIALSAPQVFRSPYLCDTQAHFGLGLKDAADRLGICATTLKRACRRVGIQRWPRRLVPTAAEAAGLSRTTAFIAVWALSA